MGFETGARTDLYKLAHGTCEDEECFGIDHEGAPRSMPYVWDGKPLENGGFNVQGSHKERRDYRGQDPNIYNQDGTRRGYIHCTWCHMRHEAGVLCNPSAAALLATNQTTLTYRRIIEEGADMDVPFGILSDRETVRVNNIRREKLKGVLFKKYGQVLADPPKHYIMDIVAK